MTIIDRARQIRALMERMAQSLPDADAVIVPDVFPTWAPGVSYTAGDRVSYDGQLWTVLQAHRSQDDWPPDAVPALFKRTASPGEEWPEWVQPTGAHDAYSAGDRVSHNGGHWISMVDGNVWEPSAAISTIWEAV